jgi:hypothetical protein
MDEQLDWTDAIRLADPEQFGLRWQSGLSRRSLTKAESAIALYYELQAKSTCPQATVGIQTPGFWILTPDFRFQIVKEHETGLFPAHHSSLITHHWLRPLLRRVIKTLAKSGKRCFHKYL